MADPIITKIGDVSAYLDAVAHGFEGTRAEFGELLANSANYAQSAESAASAAVASAATATTKAGEATTAATAAQTAKTQTEAAASQALTDIGTAESGAIGAIQTEGATQTANATAQAQAAAQSATTASTKASEASASATTATTKATEAAASATSAANAASVAQGVLESIPEDYSDLSEDVDQLKADLNNGVSYTLELGNINMSVSGWNYYSSTTRVRIKQGETISLKKGSVIGLYDYTSYNMYIGWLINGTYKQQGWLVSDFIAPEDAEYTILVTKTPETSITIEEVTQQLFVFAYGHPLSNAYYGDRLAKKAVYDYAVTIPTTNFQYGHIDTEGNDATTDIVSRARSGYIKVPKGAVVRAYTIYVFEYDENKALRANSGGFVNAYTVTGNGYVRICEFVSNGNVRSVTITYPVQIPSAYVSDYSKQETEKWKNKWLFDVAHRGSNRYIAPDTLPAYVNAKAEGYNSIEGDIRVTSDGHYVIHHDDGMPSSNSYLISTHTLSELRANANMGYFNGEALPILDLKEWLLLAKNLDMFVFAEFKTTLTNEQIIECMTIARDCGMQDRVAWMTELSNASVFRGFYPLCYLAIVNTLDYSAASQYVLAQHPERTFLYTGTTNITDALVTSCASVGLGVVGWCITYSWMFGDDWTEEQVKTEIKRALACGAKGMTLDYWTIADIYKETYSAYLLNT